MPQLPNQPEDILDGVDPSGQPTGRPGEYPGRSASKSPPPLSLEQVIAQKKASAGFQKAAPPLAVPVPPSRPVSRPAAEPEDILGELEAPADKVSRPAAGAATEPDLSASEPPVRADAPSIKQPPLLRNPKLYIIVAAMIGIIFIGTVGWFVASKIFKAGPGENFIPAAEVPTTAPSSGQPAAAVSQPEVDSDLDGLSDREERLYGTDINLVDTDSDGLTDRDEVKIFKTDPNEPDSDGDGYSDGEEVRAGYDPKGSGRF